MRVLEGLHHLLRAWGARGRVFESLRPDQKSLENPSTYRCLGFFMPPFRESLRDFCGTLRKNYQFALRKIVSTGARLSVAETLFAAVIS